MSIDSLKAAGNVAFSSGRFLEAIDRFTEAIALDTLNHVLYSNRSAAQVRLAYRLTTVAAMHYYPPVIACNPMSILEG